MQELDIILLLFTFLKDESLSICIYVYTCTYAYKEDWKWVEIEPVAYWTWWNDTWHIEYTAEEDRKVFPSQVDGVVRSNKLDYIVVVAVRAQHHTTRWVWTKLTFTFAWHFSISTFRWSLLSDWSRSTSLSFYFLSLTPLPWPGKTRQRTLKREKTGTENFVSFANYERQQHNIDCFFLLSVSFFQIVT